MTEANEGADHHGDPDEGPEDPLPDYDAGEISADGADPADDADENPADALAGLLSAMLGSGDIDLSQLGQQLGLGDLGNLDLSKLDLSNLDLDNLDLSNLDLGSLGGHLPAGFGAELPPGLMNLPGMPQDAASLQAMISSVQQMMESGGDGPVNWEIATNVARTAAAEGGDPSVGEAQQRRVAEALRTADLWLDRVTDLPAASARTQAWSRAEWIENTMPVWKIVVEPVALSVGEAMAKALTDQAPPELAAVLGNALPMMRKMGGTFFGAQLGQAIGGLSREVIGSGDVGLPLLPAGQAALLPVNLAEFGAGLGLEEDEVRLYMALREAAFARLVAGVPWLRAHLLAAVEEYARGIVIDTGRIEAAVRELDPNDPQSLQQALASDLFEPERTPQQQAALDRLETALALVEGWIDYVVDAAARHSLPHAAALQETVRRRRAAGGPAEHTFASLVGLELRPRRLREAAAVWAELTTARGMSGRDALWSHPDIVPGEEAFADPRGFATADHEAKDDLDAELSRILTEGEGGGDGKGKGPDAPRA